MMLKLVYTSIWESVKVRIIFVLEEFKCLQSDGQTANTGISYY